MLVLFDIDGTLLLSGGAGLTAMQDAGRLLFGTSFTIEGVDFAGRLDPHIFHDIATRNGIDVPGDHHEAFRTCYHEQLNERLGTTHQSICLPGVAELIAALAADDTVTLGIVTGNYPETGQLKIASAGLAEVAFEASAWGSDGATRRDLPRVAMERFTATSGREITGAEVVVIGDTPHDIDCAKANGCRVIAVGTGPAHGLCDLEGADLLVDDLSDVEQIYRWIVD